MDYIVVDGNGAIVVKESADKVIVTPSPGTASYVYEASIDQRLRVLIDEFGECPYVYVGNGPWSINGREYTADDIASLSIFS